MINATPGICPWLTKPDHFTIQSVSIVQIELLANQACSATANRYAAPSVAQWDDFYWASSVVSHKELYKPFGLPVIISPASVTISAPSIYKVTYGTPH